MKDMERDLREMMRRRVDGVRHGPQPSRGLVRRARVARARTATFAAAAAVALIIGGFTVTDLPAERGTIQPADDDAGPSGPTPGETPQDAEASGWTPDILVERLGGKVTFHAPLPWKQSFAGPWALWLDGKPEERIYVLVDPLPIDEVCRQGPAPADAGALAQSITSDPDLVTTEPVAVTVGGIEALRMDVVAATGASGCRDEVPGVLREAGTERVVKVQNTIIVGGGSFPVSRAGRHRMQLYLLDVPGSARILAIAIVAPEDRFEPVVEAAAPVLESFEFR